MLKAAFVFLYMVLLAVQTATGFLYNIAGGIRPKAVVVIDNIIDVTLVSWLGKEMASAALVGLGFVFGYMAYRRAAREQAARQNAGRSSVVPGAPMPPVPAAQERD